MQKKQIMQIRGVSVTILLGCVRRFSYSVVTVRCMPLLLFSRDGEVYAVAPIQSRRRGVCRCSYSVATVNTSSPFMRMEVSFHVPSGCLL